MNITIPATLLNIKLNQKAPNETGEGFEDFVINFSLNYIIRFSLSHIYLFTKCKLSQFFHLHIIINKMLQFFGAVNKPCIIKIEKLSVCLST